MEFVRRNWAVFTLALLPLAVLWRAVFLGETIGPWDQILQMAPWNGPAPASSWDVLQADGVLQFYPWRDLVFDAWRRGHLPLWNPYQLCGTPLLANSQSAGFYPLHIAAGLLRLPTSLAVTLLAWFHLAWSALGARALAKSFGANEQGAVIAGAGFGLSAFMVAWTPLASVVTTCAWIPWCLYCAKRSVDSDRPAAWAGRLAVSVAMMMLGGHLQFAAYGLIGLAVFGATVLLQARAMATGWALIATGVVAGGLLSCPQVLPALEFSKQSHRQSRPTAEGAAAYGASALRFPELVGFAAPSAVGLPGQPWSPESSGLPFPSYWPAYLKRGSAFAEGALAIGPLLFALLFLQRRDRWRPVLAPIAVSSVGVLLALGPLSVLLYYVLPGWSATGSPGRAAVLAVLGLCVWGGTLWPEPDPSRPPGRALAGLAAGLLATVLAAFVCGAVMKPYMAGFEGLSDLVLHALNQPVPVAASFVLVGAGLAALKYRPNLALPACLAGTLLAGPLLCLPTGRALTPGRHGAFNERTAFVNWEWELLVAAKAIAPGNLATVERLYDVAGYDSLLDRDTLELLRAVDAGNDPAPPANGNMMFVKPDFVPERLAELGVTSVWSLRPLEQLASKPLANQNWLVHRLDGPGRVSADTGKAEIVADFTDRQTVVATGPGSLTVRDRNMPGWSATVDGRSAAIVGDRSDGSGPWRRVELPEGEHTVEFRYSPPGLRNGILLGIVGLLAAAGLFGAGARRSASSKTEPEEPGPQAIVV